MCFAQGVLNDIDTDAEGQVMMVEQFIAEVGLLCNCNDKRKESRIPAAQPESSKEPWQLQDCG